jgi:hypothetical protein
MQAIFAAASRTIAYVGPENDDSVAIMRIAQCSRRIKPLPPLPSAAAQRFFSRPYWSRVWIIQEIAAAGKVEVFCGKYAPWENLCSLVKELAEDTQYSGFTFIKTLIDVRRRWLQGRLNLLSTLNMTRLSECKDPKDKIFGVIGLTSDGVGILPEPNYTLSTQDLCLSVTISLIQRYGMDIILLGLQNDVPSELPSWCPDYFNLATNPFDSRIFAYIHRDEGKSSISSFAKHKWNASRPSEREATFEYLEFQTPQDHLHMPTVLKTRARPLGKIESLGWVSKDGDSSSFPTGTHNSTTHDIKPHILKAFISVFSWDSSENFEFYSVAACILTNLFAVTFRPSNPAGREKNCQAIAVVQWLNANKKFNAFGKSLEDHARGLGSLMWSNKRVWGWLEVSWTDEDIIHTTLANIESEGLRLMTLASLDKNEHGIGWAHPNALLGDEVFVIPGCTVPIILRQKGEEKSYCVVGDAIVCGVMDGKSQNHYASNIEIV